MLRWLLVLMLVPYGLGLGSVGLFESEETRYAQIAKEMAQSHDWLVPRLEGLPYLEKPPLTVWATALAFKVLGVSEFSARVVPLLCALLMLVFTYRIARRIGGERHALLACIVLASSPLFFSMGRILATDSPFALALLVAMDALLAIREKRTAASQVELGLGVAAALLAKGPLGIVLIGFAVAVIAWQDRSWRFFLEPLRPVPLFLGFGIGLPWFWLIQQKIPEFFDFFVMRHHLQRFFGPAEFDPDLHAKPWNYYLPIFAAMALPWMCWVGASRRQLAKLADPRPARALWMWALLMFCFFTLGSGKRIAYLLPLLPPVAVLLALAWGELSQRSFRRVAVVMALCLFVVPFGLSHVEENLSMRRMAERVRTMENSQGRKLFVYPSYFPGASFYLERGIPAFGSLKELEFGAQIEPSSATVPLDGALRGEQLLRQPGTMRILGRRNHLERKLPIWSQSARWNTVAQDEHWMLIEN